MSSEGTKKRPIRIKDELWNAASAKATKEGTNVSAKVRTFLTDWVESDEPPRPESLTDQQDTPKEA
ncbi:hypothetical protein ASH00_15825 [Arthrobacter sp. Soil782]|nr:hypothetical protein ASH00_15825 [Arthrobacter sp. Soil782]